MDDHIVVSTRERKVSRGPKHLGSSMRSDKSSVERRRSTGKDAQLQLRHETLLLKRRGLMGGGVEALPSPTSFDEETEPTEVPVQFLSGYLEMLRTALGVATPNTHGEAIDTDWATADGVPHLHYSTMMLAKLVSSERPDYRQVRGHLATSTDLVALVVSVLQRGAGSELSALRILASVLEDEDQWQRGLKGAVEAETALLRAVVQMIGKKQSGGMSDEDCAITEQAAGCVTSWRCFSGAVFRLLVLDADVISVLLSRLWRLIVDGAAIAAKTPSPATAAAVACACAVAAVAEGPPLGEEDDVSTSVTEQPFLPQFHLVAPHLPLVGGQLMPALLASSAPASATIIGFLFTAVAYTLFPFPEPTGDDDADKGDQPQPTMTCHSRSTVVADAVLPHVARCFVVSAAAAADPGTQKAQGQQEEGTPLLAKSVNIHVRQGTLELMSRLAVQSAATVDRLVPLIPLLAGLVSHPDRGTRRRSLYVLGTIALESARHRRLVVASNAAAQAIVQFACPELEVRREAAVFVSSLVSGRDPWEEAEYLVQRCGVVSAICSAMQSGSADDALIEGLVEAAEAILTVGFGDEAMRRLAATGAAVECRAACWPQQNGGSGNRYASMFKDGQFFNMLLFLRKRGSFPSISRVLGKFAPLELNIE